MHHPLIAYVENSLPAASQQERFAAIRQWDIALEIANLEDGQERSYQDAQILIAAVQAYQMHEFHPLHRDSSHRQQAIIHVNNTLELAARLHAPRIVTVCGFGHDLMDCPLERSLDFFSKLADRAKGLGVRMMIEPLSPKRAGAMTHPDEVAHLIACLDQPTVFSILLDTGHLLDSGFDLTTFFSTWHHPIEELQLKGMNSAPPEITLPIATWLEKMNPLPDVICIEHRQPITWKGFEQIVKWLQQR